MSGINQVGTGLGGLGFGKPQQVNRNVDTGAKPANSIEETAGNRAGISAPDVGGASGSGTVLAPSQNTSLQPAQTAAPAQPKSWQMSVSDLVKQLVNQNIPNTPLNKQLAFSMMKHGIELSSEKFDQASKLLRGKTSDSALESTVLTMAKGLESAPKSVDMLNNFLARDLQVQAQIAKVSESLAHFQSQMMISKGLDFGLVGAISSVITSVDIELKKMTKKLVDDEVPVEGPKRGDVLTDLYGFRQLLSGLDEKLLEQGADRKISSDPELSRQIQQTKSELDNLLDNLVSQLVLSKDTVNQKVGEFENFAYWQISNPLAGVQSSIDILIKKDPAKRSEIDPAKTKIVLRFDTQDLGEIVLFLVILDKRVWYTFHSEKEDTSRLILNLNAELKEKMKDIDYDLVGFQSLRKKVDIKKLLLPTLNLDNMVRINAEI